MAGTVHLSEKLLLHAHRPCTSSGTACTQPLQQCTAALPPTFNLTPHLALFQVRLAEKLLLDEHVGALCTMLRGASPYTTTAGTVSTQAAALELQPSPQP